MPSPHPLRPATRHDGPEILRLVRELATFERLDPPTPEAGARLLADAFDRKEIEIFVADAEDARLGLYVIVAWAYSSFLAKPTLWIEDLYVTPALRGTGLAESAVRFLSALALERGAGRIEGVVLGWNAVARRFYARTGASEMADWILFRYDEEALRRLAGR